MSYPSDVQFFDDGLAVFDYGEKRLHVLRVATGRGVRVVGRRGPGPAEFGDRPVWLFGTRDRLTMVEATDGRVTELVGGDLRHLSTTVRRRWMTGCALGEHQLLFQELGHDAHDYFVSKREDTGRAIDSVASPVPRLRDLSFMVRQARLRQIDDETCAVVPVYHREFAILSATLSARVGIQVEDLPEARSIESSRSGMRRSSIARGARSGALDVRRWRQSLLILFEGATEFRRRLIDVYDWSTLGYRGTILLPLEASRIALRGDTLVVAGEQEDEPVLAAFVLRLNESRK